MKEQKVLKIKNKKLSDFWLCECSRFKKIFSVFKNFLVIHANLTKFVGSIFRTKNIEFFSTKIMFFLYFLAMFIFVKPSETTSWKNHPVDAKKSFTFVCNECGHNKPSSWSKKNCTHSWEVKALGLFFCKRQLSIFWLFWQHLGVKLIFGNTEYKSVSLLFALSVARFNQLLIF